MRRVVESHPVCLDLYANFKFDQSVFAIHDSRPIFEISDDHPLNTVGHQTPAIIDELQTSLMHQSVFPGVNRGVELVPLPRAYARNGAPRRWLGDKIPRDFRNV